MNINRKIDKLAQSIDTATDKRDVSKLHFLVKDIQKLQTKEDISDQDMSILLFFQANAYAALSQCCSNDSSEYSELELGSLRAAIASRGFEALLPEFRVKIRTNLGNLLTNWSRFPEAIEHYDAALKIIPNYGLTHANRARALTGFARFANDGGHQQMLLYAAQRGYLAAVEEKAMFESEDQIYRLGPEFEALAERIGSAVDIGSCDEALEKYQDDLGRSKAEKSYRKFCLENVLFLNPLNDGFEHAIAAADPYTITNIIIPTEEMDVHPPLEFSLFNRIKQEYVSTRYFYYEAISSSGVHFSDKLVKLADTYDYTLHGIAFERLRLSYRAAYSILDRVAVLVNQYWKLGHKTTSISFAGVWHQKRGSENLHPIVTEAHNPALMALFELSKDIHSSQRQSISEPDARFLADLRNALEHRFVEITDDFAGYISEYIDLPKSGRVRIPLSILEDRTLRMIRIARAAIIYIVQSINLEEQRKQEAKKGLYAGGSILDVRDRDKRRWN